MADRCTWCACASDHQHVVRNAGGTLQVPVICMAQGSVKTGQLFTKADRAKAFVIKVTADWAAAIEHCAAGLVLCVRHCDASCGQVT